MNILFCCHDFKKENLRLMPWRYIYEISKRLVHKGHDISVLSVVKDDELKKDSIDGINILPVKPTTLFGSQSAQKLFSNIDFIVWSSSPLTYLFHKKLRAINKPLILLFTGPFYTFSEVKKAHSFNVPFQQLRSHYKNAALPLKLTTNLINTDFVKKAIVLSEKNMKILINKGALETKIMLVPPGYDGDKLSDFKEITNENIRNTLNLTVNHKIFIYIGSLYQIRGVDILIEAFSDVCKKVENILLLILARTDTESEILRIARLIKRYRVGKKVKLISGFFEKSQVANYLFASDTVVLPFILVPSDMPLGALEAMALGKPVITTEVDGMPEMVKDRGIIVKPGDRDALSKAIITLSLDSALYNSLKANCVSYMSKYPTWDEIAERFYSILV